MQTGKERSRRTKNNLIINIITINMLAWEIANSFQKRPEVQWHTQRSWTMSDAPPWVRTNWQFTVKCLLCSSHSIRWSLRTKIYTRVFGEDATFNCADTECARRPTFSSLFLPHHHLVIMKAASLAADRSLMRRRIIKRHRVFVFIERGVLLSHLSAIHLCNDGCNAGTGFMIRGSLKKKSCFCPSFTMFSTIGGLLERCRGGQSSDPRLGLMQDGRVSQHNQHKPLKFM